MQAFNSRSGGYHLRPDLGLHWRYEVIARSCRFLRPTSQSFLSNALRKCCKIVIRWTSILWSVVGIIIRRYGHEKKATRKGQRIQQLRNRFFSEHGMQQEPSALQHMTPALDLIHSRSGGPAHSEYAGIVRRIMPVLSDKILTKKALNLFTDKLRKFPFPCGWGRIQSPATHLKSWDIREYTRASVVISISL